MSLQIADYASILTGGFWSTLAVVELPAEPTLVMTDKGDGTGAAYIIAGADDDAINTIYIRRYGELSWTSIAEIVGNGSGDVEISVTGQYFAYVKSARGAAFSLSAIVSFSVTLATSSEMIVLADAVRDELGEHTFTQDVLAERGYLTASYLQDLTTLSVLVVPMERTATRAIRHEDSQQYQIDIILMEKLADANIVSRCDALIKLSDEIYRLFRRIELNNFNCSEIVFNPLYDHDALLEMKTFYGVISLFFTEVT